MGGDVDGKSFVADLDSDTEDGDTTDVCCDNGNVVYDSVDTDHENDDNDVIEAGNGDVDDGVGVDNDYDAAL